jgi:aerobic-type carbon monoxide dehydrogenase small subunit (CoxS/CutS family)
MTAERGKSVAPRDVDDEGRVLLSLRVNGREHRVRVRPGHTLLEVLNSQLRLTGTREGCGVGMCGACTILLDGKPTSGCLMLAFRAEGHDVLTIEGLSDSSAALHPVQEAYLARTGFQCSYCTPGFILMTKALLEERPDASFDEARDYLAGNLCRCGSYVKILEAVLDAKNRLRSL